MADKICPKCSAKMELYGAVLAIPMRASNLLLIALWANSAVISLEPVVVASSLCRGRVKR
jgi:hypothetical protein